MPKITPFLWFQVPLREVVDYYGSIFRDFQVHNVSPRSASFEIEGQRFLALNGGPHHPFNDAISFFIDCEDQDEVDYYWTRLTADGGAESMCGWLKDRYGVSWQIVPQGMDEYFSGKDPKRAERMMQAIHTMVKLDIAGLEAAARG